MCSQRAVFDGGAAQKTGVTVTANPAAEEPAPQGLRRRWRSRLLGLVGRHQGLRLGRLGRLGAAPGVGGRCAGMNGRRRRRGKLAGPESLLDGPPGQLLWIKRE